MTEYIIKCKLRVQKHGEVFTPKNIVERMLNTPEIRETCKSLTKTFLEPSAGEGAFLIAILEKKLEKVIEEYNNDLIQFENYSLFALTTLYGVELLEDNAQTCVMNMFQMYYDIYQEQVQYHNGKPKKKVLDSAKQIISSNIRQGNFLTRKTLDGKALVFSEWHPVNMRKTTKNIRIQRTEYTLDEIYENVKKESGMTIHRKKQNQEQLNMFAFLEEEDVEIVTELGKDMKYTVVKLTDVYKVEMEEA